jgi:ATP-dependent DNA helicase RecG
MATDDFLVINALFQEQPLPDNLRSRTKRLIELGLVEHVSRNKFVLARSLYEVADQTGVHTRLVGLDRDTNKELILKHIRRNREQGTPFRELEQVLPSHSRNQIKVLVRELHQADLIYVVGKTSAARWYAR